MFSMTISGHRQKTCERSEKQEMILEDPLTLEDVERLCKQDWSKIRLCKLRPCKMSQKKTVVSAKGDGEEPLREGTPVVL